MRYLKQSTAVEVKVGPFLDETDGKTAETALTISQADVRLAKNGGDWAQKAETTTLVHEENGWYRCLLDTTDTDTVGILMLAIHESGALPVWVEFHVVVANVYDSLFGAGTDKLDVNVEEWNTTAVPAEHTAGYPVVTVKDGTGTGEIDTTSGGVLVAAMAANAITASAIADGAIDAGALAADCITAAKVAADVSAEIADAVWDEDATGHQTGGTFGQAIGDPGADTNTIFAATVTNATGNTVGDDTTTLLSRLGTPSNLGGGATVAANLSDIEAQTDDIGAAGAGLTAVPWNAAWDAEVQSEVNDALVVNNLDHLVLSAVDSTFDFTVHPDSVIGYLAHNGVGTGTPTGYDRTLQSLEAIGSYVDTELAAVKAVTDKLDTMVVLNPSTPGTSGDYRFYREAVEAVWDVTLTDHVDSGSTGSALNAAGSAGDPWATALPGAYGAGTAGRLVGRSLPDVVAGGSGGLLIAGSNAATTFSGLTTGALSCTTITASGAVAFQSTFAVTTSTSLAALSATTITASGTTSLAAVTTSGTVTMNALTVTNALTAGSNAVPWNAAWDAEVQSEVEDGLNNLGYTTTVSGRIDVAVSTRLASSSYTAPLTAAQTQTECEEALQTYHLDHLIASADPGSVVADSSFLAKLVSKSATPAFSSYNNTTDSLEALRDRGDAAWITATGFSTHSAADVWAVATRALTVLDEDSTTLDLDATIRAAVGLASANLDTQLSTIDDFLDTEIAAIKAKTDNLPSDPADQSAVEAAINALLTTQLTESYNADGVAPTVAQALFVIMQRLTEFSISGTTITVKKLNGSTTALTLTLDSASTPTSSTRAP